MKFLVLYALICSVVFSAKLPSIFQKCKSKDPICLKGAVQDALPKLKGGLPDWGVPSLDPLHIPEMTIGAGQRVVQLTQYYKDAYLTGSSNIKITDFKFDLETGKIVIHFTFPKWVFKANYEVRGKILVLPVLGKGLCTTILENGNGTQTFKIETYKKKGKMYMRSIDGNLDIIPQKVTYQFDNLFNGDKALGDNINKVLNENWKEVYDEVKHGYGEVYSATFMNIMNRILSRLPMSEIFVDVTK